MSLWYSLDEAIMAAHHVQRLLEQAVERELIRQGAVSGDLVVIDFRDNQLVLEQERAARVLQALLDAYDHAREIGGTADE